MKKTFENSSTRAKAGLVGLFAVFALTVANSNELQAQNNALALNNKAKTAEVVNNDKLTAPRVTRGDADAASDASKNKRLSIYVTGGDEGRMSVEEYANVLAKSFADTRFTDKPMNIDVKFLKTSGPVKASLYMDENIYTHGKTYVFTPEQIGGAIQVIGDHFVATYGDHLVILGKVSSNAIAGINPPENN
ncbi:hypothetical protein [Roseivirga sp. 4D4]|uniref:hypothetical protein n=1 Tax=Roseivirga sp. 4D4 TaxID=1889784 RepID=UPI001112FC83|nr:hypothetical protein [Roseivirga sp. 4D4]